MTLRSDRPGATPPRPPRFHNTLTGVKEELVPLEPGRVRMYTCGPTVHDRIHVGNFRTFLFEDVLRRTLRRAGYAVTQVMNITDVDDKIIRKAREAGVTIGAYTAAYTRLFFEDARRLGIEPAEHYPRATDYVPQMVRLVERLRERGHTYERDGSVYFRIASFPGYGKLSGVDLSASLDGARVDADEYDKDDPKDFVLWKAAKPGEDAWDTPLGRGRPGWHLECSAMAMELLGESFDIHTGGVDNVFPHHENEIAQSEAATGRPLARLWLHAQHLTVGETKMAKSLGNFVTLGELIEQGHDPLAVRYLLISAHYRTPQRFGDEGLAQAAAALERLRDLRDRLVEAAGDAAPSEAPDPVIDEAEEGFAGALADDLNTPRALAAVFGFVRASNTLLDEGMEPGRAAAHLAALRSWDEVLGVLGEPAAAEPPEIASLVREREDARSRRDFARSDAIRRTLEERGWLVEDTPSGPRLKKVPAG